ncbi:MAG: hypothetical protein QHI48_01745 [Bacteroidota bacterium]|nr:hypothetical protein [Bacteroidota bacterium]
MKPLRHLLPLFLLLFIPLFITPRSAAQLVHAVGTPVVPQTAFSSSRRLHEYHFAITAGPGLVTYSGDVDRVGLFPNGDHYWKPCVHLAFQTLVFTPAEWLDVVAITESEYGSFQGKSDVYDFRTRAFQVSAGIKFEFFPRFPLRLYASGSGGVLLFSPTVTIKSPETEALYPRFRGTAKSALAIPITIGILWTLGESYDFYYRFTKTISTTDNLDGWVSQDRDNYQSFSIGIILYL